MKRQNVHSAIGALTTLFYVHQDNYLGMTTMEFYVEMGLLQDASLIAEIFEETRCGDLLNVIRLFDDVAAQRIEDILRGATL
ncbi:hypothetical protein IQ781_21695 [Bacillus sp. N447-1]|uniref:hypothetical protein n=1 Tax=Bacillus TaxID=1386 RepID=UPI0005E57DE1|nr:MULTISPECIES: hypothetical protein [Bacillus]CEY30778.1 Uncharacterised protein [Streptococcus pneumoniae]TNP09590.1 hypothetical protein FHY65_00855 [Bacillus cereus]UNT68055.1 hypothetical protein IQ781_21695 [Bacillus sp. N447-1]CGF77990.1 Uncharacterised protein [Streptococcus pneumoniae]CIZ86983.1 Uncharacterised protein [Streptococcus pneumoniae]